MLKAIVPLFDAADAYGSYKPDGELALLPDLETMRENRELLQSIATAATGSRLERRPDPDNDDPGRVIWRIWVNDGVSQGGFEVTFMARVRSDDYLTDCLWAVEDDSGENVMIDQNCDAVPEAEEPARRASARSHRKREGHQGNAARHRSICPRRQ